MEQNPNWEEYKRTKALGKQPGCAYSMTRDRYMTEFYMVQIRDD